MATSILYLPYPSTELLPEAYTESQLKRSGDFDFRMSIMI